MKLAGIASKRPGIALAVGQMLHSFFWWGGAEYLESSLAPQGPSAVVDETALELHQIAVRHAGNIDNDMTIITTMTIKITITITRITITIIITITMTITTITMTMAGCDAPETPQAVMRQ